jgi:hypothetical protein
MRESLPGEHPAGMPSQSLLRLSSFGNGSQVIEITGGYFGNFFQMRLEIIGYSSGF